MECGSKKSDNIPVNIDFSSEAVERICVKPDLDQLYVRPDLLEVGLNDDVEDYVNCDLVQESRVPKKEIHNVSNKDEPVNQESKDLENASEEDESDVNSSHSSNETPSSRKPECDAADGPESTDMITVGSTIEQEPCHERDIRNYAPHRICHCDIPAVTTECMLWHVDKNFMQRLFKCETCKKYSFQMPAGLPEEGSTQNKRALFEPSQDKPRRNFFRKTPPEENIFSYKNLYSCHICNNWFSKHSNYVKHVQNHSAPRIFDCNLCDKSFTKKRALVSHLEYHKGERNFKCLECGKMFTRKWSLLEHRYIHTREKKFVCHLCGKSFSYKNSLNSHFYVHEGIKRYECDICKMKFVNRPQLSRHLKVHSGIKRYECDICKKKFRDKTHVETHLLVHFGEKVFNCQMCDKSFAYKGSLRTHYLQVHSLNKNEYEWINGAYKNISLKLN